MSYDPAIHHRRSIRLKGYDYSQGGAYFVTICVHDRVCLLGEVADEAAQLSIFGEIVLRCWEELPEHYPTVELGMIVVMPNHVHGILVLSDGDGSRKRSGLGEVVRAFKSFSARRINEQRQMPGAAVWQRGFYERIVRSEREFERFRGYIWENPVRWEMDRMNPDKPAPW